MLPFYFVNVFAEGKYTGNRLAVFYSSTKWKKADMQSLAAESRFPETAFIQPRSSKEWELHLFTPTEEIPFTGHAILGSAAIVRSRLATEELTEIPFYLKSGKVTVSVGEENMLWLENFQPIFGEELPIEAIAPMLGLAPTVFHRSFPIQVVSSGLPFLMVPLNHLDAVKRVRLNPLKYQNLCRETEAKAVFVFSPDTYDVDNQFNARVFGEYFGIPEDAASGSGNGCLGGYLIHHNYFDTPQIECRVEQGHEINRPSLLHIKAVKNQDLNPSVKVGGRVRLVAEGKWDL